MVKYDSNYWIVSLVYTIAMIIYTIYVFYYNSITHTCVHILQKNLNKILYIIKQNDGKFLFHMHA